jgi:hypothetical protein
MPLREKESGDAMGIMVPPRELRPPIERRFEEKPSKFPFESSFSMESGRRLLRPMCGLATGSL